ncbi:MAG TPA: hypothetical protein VFY42_07305 [Gemmatimonadales bacterium]|nr:hypothetical protein [Gemmatimonadales bacterium]
MSTATLTQWARYVAVLLAGFIAGGRIVSAIHSWREWHTWAARDPSGADAYRTFFMVDMAIVALTLSIAGLIWWLLRPRPLR